MNDESQLALVRFDFTSGALRGSQLMLYPRCLVHRSDSHLETMPLARVTALKVSFEREPRITLPNREWTSRQLNRMLTTSSVRQT